jgi:hypothetical protein
MTELNLDDWCGRSLTIEGREFRVAGTTARQAEGMAPAFQLLEIRAQPALRIDLALPAAWNGRLYANGNGGYAGEAVDSPLRDISRAIALARGFAVVGSNTGHDAEVDPLASFGRDRAKLIDYAYLAVHHSVLVAKVLLPKIYGSEVQYSYFDGCSTGGRQALMAAQRYPGDFDGIISGCPVFDFTLTQLASVYTGQRLVGRNIGARQMQIIAQSVNRRFGAPESGSPELIDQPLDADFDALRDLPIGMDPTGGDARLTKDQAEALSAIYKDAKLGRKHTFPGLPIGAEAAGAWLPGLTPSSGWAGWLYASDEGFFAGAPDGVRVTFGESFLQGMLGYQGRWQDFDFSDAALKGLEELAALTDATDPNLAVFAGRGGKLMLYHGLADVAVNPARTVAYFKSVQKQLGSLVDRFMRFYTPPGMFHCFGGYGPSQFDMLTPLMDWVERGRAPDAVIAAQDATSSPRGARTRPLYPYPKVPKYNGSGDPNSADSYEGVLPS